APASPAAFAVSDPFSSSSDGMLRPRRPGRDSLTGADMEQMTVPDAPAYRRSERGALLYSVARMRTRPAAILLAIIVLMAPGAVATAANSRLTPKPPVPRRTFTTGPEETEALGAELAARLQPGDVVLVEGELGAGKTTFVRGAARRLGVESLVTSPTFTIGQRYRAAVAVAHVDLYRV